MMKKGCCVCRKNFPEHYESSYGSIRLHRLGKMTGLLVYTDYCPPYHKCSKSDSKPAVFYPINFCPNCGRKLSRAYYDKDVYGEERKDTD